MSDGTIVKRMQQVNGWKRALNKARRTIGKEEIDKEPTDSWKAKMLLAEHSPIRMVEYDWTWENIEMWVTVHFVRHSVGCEKFVSTQRSDRIGIDRHSIPQSSLNNMDMVANAQSIMNISRKRMCSCASKETNNAWKMVVEKIREIDPVLADKCVPECVYRGFCPEWMKSCGYDKTEKFRLHLELYRKTDY